MVSIDHFSRKVVCIRPLSSQSAQHITEALELAFRAFGPPKHLISDRGSGFDSDAMACAHRFLVDAKKDETVWHRNGNGLDNRRANLVVSSRG
jgi:hypothetical protein